MRGPYYYLIWTLLSFAVSCSIHMMQYAVALATVVAWAVTGDFKIHFQAIIYFLGGSHIHNNVVARATNLPSIKW
jgi:hypothetical protein